MAAHYLSASLLARVYPAQMIEAILDAHGVNSPRNRSLPALATVYYGMVLSLHPDVAYEEVYAVVAQGLGWMRGQSTSPVIAKSSGRAARRKIGHAPLKELHRALCTVLRSRRQRRNRCRLCRAGQREARYRTLRAAELGRAFE